MLIAFHGRLEAEPKNPIYQSNLHEDKATALFCRAFEYLGHDNIFVNACLFFDTSIIRPLSVYSMGDESIGMAVEIEDQNDI